MISVGLAAMEEVDESVLVHMEAAIRDNYPADVIRLKPIGPPGPEYDSTRHQYSAPLILKRVLGATPPGIDKMLAVTGLDLFIPMLSFVYGQAQLNGKAGIVSVARLRQEFYSMPPNEAVLLARSRKEVVHETGHLFNLVHCSTSACAMSLSTSVRQIDLKSDALCPACSALIWETSK